MWVFQLFRSKNSSSNLREFPIRKWPNNAGSWPKHIANISYAVLTSYTGNFRGAKYPDFSKSRVVII